MKAEIKKSPFVIGLTGGIGSGKSTVSAMFRKLGARVVDADVLAREIVQPGKPAWKEIKKTFGSSVLNPDRTLNRQALAKVVFNHPEALERLNQITHPRVYRNIRMAIARAIDEGTPGIILDIPLLLEDPHPLHLDRVVVVYTPRSIQLKRARERDGLSRKEAEQRLRNQMPIAQKKKMADVVIDNRGDLKETWRQVQEFWKGLKKEKAGGNLRPGLNDNLK